MEKKEFLGDLKVIQPSKLIKKESSNDFDNFFLVLGLIFNDLQGLLLFIDSFNKNHREPKIDGSEPPSVHLGQWAGMQNQANRLMTGFISEFLIFVEKNIKVVGSINFQVLVKSLPDKVKRDWAHIQAVLDSKKTSDFLSEIAQVRSNVSFHYDQNLSEMRKGFIKKFFDTPKNKYNNKAYYTLGDNTESTRFFYCDGAVEEYLKLHLKVSEQTNYNRELKKLVEKTNTSIRFLMEAYLNKKTGS